MNANQTMLNETLDVCIKKQRITISISRGLVDSADTLIVFVKCCVQLNNLKLVFPTVSHYLWSVSEKISAAE